MRVYNHSSWLVIFCTTNKSRVLAGERWQIFENSWKETQYLMNTLYIINNIYFYSIYTAYLHQMADELKNCCQTAVGTDEFARQLPAHKRLRLRPPRPRRDRTRELPRKWHRRWRNDKEGVTWLFHNSNWYNVPPLSSLRWISNFPAPFFGNYDRPTDQPINQPTNMKIYRVVTLSKALRI